MNEEEVSYELFKAAEADSDLVVLSWQAVNGKSYFTADVKLRLPTAERMEPDLIVADSNTVWMIEVKELHSEALLDEVKLRRLGEEMAPMEVLEQISLRSGTRVTEHTLVAGVAFDEDDLSSSIQCESRLIHVCWTFDRDGVVKMGLGGFLKQLASE
jgi:hypothetical protein